MDLAVAAVPGYFATMGAEYLYLRRRVETQGPSPADYQRDDTVTSLAMGVGSLLAPIVAQKLLGPITPTVGRYGRYLVASAIGAVAVTTVADALVRLDPAPTGASLPAGASPPAGGSRPAGASSSPERPSRRRRRDIARAARRVARIGAVASVVAGGVAITTTLAARTSATRLWKHRVLPDLGTGPVALAAATVGWDFIYYWNHRFMHEARYMWAVHVVHHSSERYNLSTALRQPVADALGTFVPYGLLSLLGVRPQMIVQARAINLLYQYWIHTDTIASLGPAEEVLNTPSHHRVHHGSNPQYLDRNHGSILISWDRLFGTFEREDEPVVYGLTKNIDTFNPLRVISNEHVDMLRDVADATTWADRLSFVVRGPGWAYARHAERAAQAATVAAVDPTELVAAQ